MKLLKLLLLSSLFTTLVTATVYEDAEDGKTDRWIVYDNEPAGATITNINQDDANYNYNHNSAIIQFRGEGRKNAYEIGARKGEKAWNNRSETVIHWSMKTDEKYKIYLYALTQKGYRKFYFSHSERDKGFISGKRTSYIHLGLGKISMDGNWHEYQYDVEALLKKFEPENKIISIDGFRVKGSMLIDDIKLTKTASTLYPRTRFYTKDKKYFFSYDSTSYYGMSAHEWFVVDTKTDKLLDYNIWRHTARQTPQFEKIEGLDIYSISTGGDGSTSLYYTIDKGKLIKLNRIKSPSELEVEYGGMCHVDSQNAKYIGDNKLEVYNFVTCKNKKRVDTFDVSNLPTIELLSTRLQ